MQAPPAATAIPPPGPLDAHRPKPGLDLALGQGAIPDHRVAAWSLVTVGILGSQHRHVCLHRLGQEALRALASPLREGGRSRELWRWEGHGRMFVHGVATPSS